MKRPQYTEDFVIYKLSDFKPKEITIDPPRKKKPQSFYDNIRKNNIPIIIDYGSGYTKAGWGNSCNPDLVFRSVVAKTKDVKNIETPIYVGNKLKDIDYMKSNFRSPFERNVIQHAGLLEHVNDYIFSEIGVNECELKTPIMYTECFANPEYCRTNIIEQFFECYNAPSLFFGVDCLFSYYYNLQDKIESYQKDDCLIISIGNTTIHIIPIIKGEIQYLDIKRINVGSSMSFEIFQKNFILKNNVHKNKFNLGVSEALYENFNYVASDYQNQLKYFKEGLNSFEDKGYINSIEFENNRIIKNELLNTFINPVLIDVGIPSTETINPEDLQKKMEIRKEQAQRLKQIMQQRKEEKKKQQHQDLTDLESFYDAYQKNSLTPQQIKPKLNFYGLESIEEVPKRIKKLKIKLKIISKETLEEEKASFLNVPDDQLNAEQLKQKRMQIVFKQAAETRAIKKEEQKKRKEEIQKLKDTDAKGYVKKLYERRNYILEKMERRKLEKQEISTRNSRLNQKRMQTLAHLGSDINLQKSKKGLEDTFGMNDEDWNIYRGISRDYGSEDENFDNKLNEVEIELREMDPDYIPIKSAEISTSYGLNSVDELIELSVERIKGPESFFQPSLSGIDQCGLSESIQIIIRKYDSDTKQRLLNNIFLTGGGSLVHNIKNRLEIDLKMNNPVGTTVSISIAKDPIFDAWKGMKLYSSKNDISKLAVTRKEYQEKGSSYFKPNIFSNVII